MALDVGAQNLASYLSTSAEASSATDWVQSYLQNQSGQSGQALSAQSGQSTSASSLLSLIGS